MLKKVLLIISILYVVVCQNGTVLYYNNLTNVERSKLNNIIAAAKSCENLICQLANKWRIRAKVSNPFSISSRIDRQSPVHRSYYSGFAAPGTPTYHPSFDPISVLASLAFLAFLLQSFASLFDRSRSILPTVISSRRSSSEQKMSGVMKQVLHALDEYENLNETLRDIQEDSADGR